MNRVVEDYADLPWHDSGQLDIFERFLDIAPEGIDRRKYEGEIEVDRELIKKSAFCERLDFRD